MTISQTANPAIWRDCYLVGDEGFGYYIARYFAASSDSAWQSLSNPSRAQTIVRYRVGDEGFEPPTFAV